MFWSANFYLNVLKWHLQICPMFSCEHLQILPVPFLEMDTASIRIATHECYLHAICNKYLCNSGFCKQWKKSRMDWASGPTTLASCFLLWANDASVKLTAGCQGNRSHTLRVSQQLVWSSTSLLNLAILFNHHG